MKFSTQRGVIDNRHGQSRRTRTIARVISRGGAALLFVTAVAGGHAQNQIAQNQNDQKYLPGGILDYSEVETREAVADFGALHPILRNLGLPESEFEFDASAGGAFTGRRGTRLTVPPLAFVTTDGKTVKGKIQIRLREVIDAFDFVTAPIGLEYTENGRREYFQSGGMFHVQATKDGQQLILGPNQKIIVHFPKVQSGDFKIYRTNTNGDWVFRGETPESNATETSESTGEIAGEFVEEGSSMVGAHIFAIDGMTWWNFDQPYPHVACVKGAIADPEKIFAGDYQIFSIGIDYRGAFDRWLSGPEFKINVHKDRTAKILIIDKNGNVGVSVAFATPDRNGFDKDPEGPANYCQTVDAITIRKIPEDVLKDRDAFMNLLELPAGTYDVNYNSGN